jgi:hypothetical protein
MEPARSAHLRYLRTVASTLALACSVQGCMTAQTYEGERLARDEVARIKGDFRVTAGAPISVLLRRVDEQVLSLSQSSVDVLPGKHTLLVDCRVQETGSVTRYSLEQDFFAGRTYRLVAETGPGLRECTAVRIEASD